MSELPGLTTYPTTEKGTPIFQPNIIPAGHYFYGTGAFDDVSGGSVGPGAQICMKTDGTANDSTEHVGRFLHYVYVTGGKLITFSADYDDWVSLLVRAPASSPEDRTGTNDGNANKVSVGPFNIIVPASGNDGDWNVDGSTLEAGEINQGLAPVPAFDANGDPNGWWDWDPTANPSITPNLTQTGVYKLFDATINLARQANRYPLGTYDVTPASSIKGKKLLPHWEWVFTLQRGNSIGEAKIAIKLDLSRVKTL